MPRVKKVFPAVQKSIMFDPQMWATMELHLYSHVEKRIPHGKISELMNQLLREYLQKQGFKL